MKPLIPLAFALLGAASVQASETITVTMQQATEKGPGAAVGTVTISESAHGLVFTPNLKGLEPGIHGFHVHAKASCDAVEADGKLTPAGAAGGHWDPNEAGRHGFPGKMTLTSATCLLSTSGRMAVPASRCWHHGSSIWRHCAIMH